MNTQKIKPKPKSTLNFKNCSCVSAYDCLQLSHTPQHRTVLIISPLIFQTTITAHMLSTAGEGRQLTSVLLMYAIARNSLKCFLNPCLFCHL